MLTGRNSGWAVYVTPSRALVNQVSGDLRRRLEGSGITIRTVLAGAEQSGILGDELELLHTNRTVTVTTPEKLDAYYRNAPELFDTCKLVIYDEAHKICDPSRGILLESLVTRFLVQRPQTRIILMSGVMSNAEEMALWLGADRTETVTVRRRPTRQVRGVAIRQDNVQVRDPAMRKGELYRRVDFHGGIVLVHEGEDLGDAINVDLSDVFQGYYLERGYGNGQRWREDRKTDHSNYNDHAIAIAQSLAHAPGNILVFVENVKSAQRACRETKLQNDQYVRERDRLATFIASELGAHHPLVEYCRRGVAYHHARLPSSVQRALEMALEQGWLKVVFATPTLREGVNTAATTVIIAGLSYWDDAAQARMPIPEMDFVNLAGRAGRTRTDTEGLIVLVPESLAQANAVEVGKKYILVGDAALRVKSQLSSLADWLERSESELTKLRSDQQAFLLGLEAAGLADGEGIETFFGYSLWGLQEDETTAKRTIVRAVRALERSRMAIGEERLALAARLGLSLTSAELMYAALADQVEMFKIREQADEMSDERLRTLLAVSLELPEILQGLLKKKVRSDAHLAALRLWLAGDDYRAILEAGREAGVLGKTSDVTEAVKYGADLSTWLSWSFGAAYAVLDSLSSEIDPYIGVLPLLVKYGVPSAAAAYVSLLGVADRTAAQILGDRFNDTADMPNLLTVSKWLDSVEEKIDAIFPAEQHFLRADLLKRQVYRGGYNPFPYLVEHFTALAEVPRGTVLTFQPEQRKLMVLSGGQVIGEVKSGQRLVDLARGALEKIVAVVTMLKADERLGTLTAIRLST